MIVGIPRPGGRHELGILFLLICRGVDDQLGVGGKVLLPKPFVVRNGEALQDGVGVELLPGVRSADLNAARLEDLRKRGHSRPLDADKVDAESREGSGKTNWLSH